MSDRSHQFPPFLPGQMKWEISAKLELGDPFSRVDHSMIDRWPHDIMLDHRPDWWSARIDHCLSVVSDHHWLLPVSDHWPRRGTGGCMNWRELYIKQGDLDDAREITAVWWGNVKKLNFVAAILDFWRPSWIDNGYLISLYSISIISTNFGTFITKWTIDTPIVIFSHFFTMQTGSS